MQTSVVQIKHSGETLGGGRWESRGLDSDRVQVSALMLGPIAGVAESFLAARVLAQVRLLSCVAPQVDLQILQTRKRFVTALELWRRGDRD